MLVITPVSVWAQAAPQADSPNATGKLLSSPELTSAQTEGRTLPAVEGSSPKEDEAIIVVAPASERTSIDRTSYLLRDNTQARTSNLIDILAQIPSVEVTPSGQLRLVGRSGVRILIDGNEVANPMAALRAMQGSQVARIEVITNPSAQFSAQGTGGIINIITRASLGPGFGGAINVSAGTFGSHEIKASPTWGRGKLSFSGSLGFSRNVSHLRVHRERVGLQDASSEASEEHSRLRNIANSLSGNLLATYKPTPQQTINFTAIAVSSDVDLSRRSEFLTSSDPGVIIGQTAAGASELESRDFSLSYRRDGRREGELLRISLKRSSSDASSATDFSTGLAEGSPTAIRSDSKTRVANLSVNYDKPFAADRRISAGGSIEHTSGLTELDAESCSGSDISADSCKIDGSWVEKAAFGTVQLPLLKGTILAGLRVEDRGYELAGVTAIRVGGTHLFPSFHFERNLTRGLKANLSYSRRISWPNINDLDPTLRFIDSTTASTGNPDLRPETTDSFEAKFKVQRSSHSAELVLYARRTHDLLSSESTLIDGVLVSRPVNIGKRSSHGASLSAQGPVAAHLRYSVTGNFLWQKLRDDDLTLGIESKNTQYSASAQLEYKDGIEGRRGADRIEIRARYSGPTNVGFYKIDDYFTLNGSWTHTFSYRWSSVLTVSDLLGPPAIRLSSFSEDTISKQTDRAAATRVNVVLSYRLGPRSR